MNVMPRILVLTLSFGSGHPRAAEAIAEEFRQTSRNADVRVINALEDCRWWFRLGYVWPYWTMVRRAPALWGRFFARRTARMNRQTAPPWTFRRGCAQVFKVITDFRPDIIVATEVAACEIAALAKRDGLTSARIVSVITDYEAEPVWIQSEVDSYAVPDEHVRHQLSVWGARAKSIIVCGVPISSAFRRRYNLNATRKNYEIGNNTPMVLVMGGGMGPTRMDQVVARLCGGREKMNVVAVTGHDARVRHKLARVRVRPPVSLRVLGWTEDIAALMQAASVLVTKPGGLTIAEATSCALPVVMFDAIPGPEQRNAARIENGGAGIMTHGAAETASAVLSLLGDDGARRRMSSCASRLAQPDATERIVRLSLNADKLPQESVRRMTA